MSLEWGQPPLETPRSPAAKAAVTTVAEVSSAHDVFAQLFTPPPPDFHHPPVAGPLYSLSTPLYTAAPPHARNSRGLSARLPDSKEP